jgi:hypothetical protein
MAVVLARHRRKYLSAMEDAPADQLLWPVVKHFLYGARETPAAEVRKSPSWLRSGANFSL